MLIPNKHNGYTRDGVRRVFFDGGGGGGGGGQTTSYTTNVPEYAKEPFMEMIGKGIALSEAPYQAYGGERTAQFTPLQRQAFGQAQTQGTAPQLGQASGIAGLAAQQGLQAGQFQPGTFTPMSVQAPSLQNFQMGPAMQVGAQRVGTQGIQAAQTGFRPNLQQFQMGPAQMVSSRDVGTQGIQAAQTGFRPDLQQFQMGGPQSFTQAGTAEQFMNPFMQNVVDIQKREAQREADISATQRGAQAVRAGAFGGSRQAIMEAEAQRNLGQRLGDIQATGSQAAFQQAQQQFNQEQAARQAAEQANLQARLGVQELGTQAGLQTALANLSNQQQAAVQSEANRLQAQGMNQEAALRSALANQQAGLTVGQQNLQAQLGVQELRTQTGLQTALANLSNQQQAAVQNEANRLQAQGMNQESALRSALANQQAGLTVGQQNLSALLGIQQLGTGQSMEAQRANQQALMDAQRAFEQSRQFGADVGLRGGAQALQGAGILGQLGQQQFGQEMDIMGARQQMGATQQQQIQNILNQQFADFQAQRDYPYQQIGFLSDLLRGTGSSTRQIYTTPQPSTLQTAAGLGTLGAGLMRAKGGSVQHYADGGITSLLGDQQLAQTAQNSSQGPMMQMAAAEEAQRRNMMRSAAPADMPQEADMTEAELIAALRQAIQQGDETKARVIAEIIEERKMPESGIAQVAPESVGEVPEGGIMGMYGGGAVAFQEGGRTPYTPRLTSGQRMLDDAIQSGLIAFEDMPDALPIQLAREGTRQTADALGNVVEAVADTKALPMSAGYLNQRERDEAAREARRAAKREREAAANRPMTATPAAAAAAASPLAAVLPASAARDAKLLERQSPTSGGLERALAVQQAGQKAIADPAGNVATPGGAGGLGAITPAGYRAQLKAAGYDIDAEQAAEKKALQDEFAARREAVAADRADLEKLIAQRGVYGEEREKEARASIEGLKGEKDQARSMALFQAGLAILSADPSRGAMAAIGEGALKGVGAYKGDLKELETKRERMSEKLDRIVDIRRQERFADDEKRGALKKEENRLTADLARETRSTLQGFGKTNLSVATAAVNAASNERMRELDRRDRAERIAQGSKTNPAQYRMLLTNEIGELLKRKESGIDWTPDDEIQLKQLRQERDGLRAYLSTSVGNASTPGQNAPKIGDVQQGYRFKGGDPSNQANWEKVK